MVKATSVLQIEDFAHWKQVWDDSAPAQQAGGISTYELHFHPTDAQRLVIVREFPDREQAHTYLTSDARQERLRAAGVVSCEDYLPRD